MSSTQPANTIIARIWTIGNVGERDLIWSIYEAQDSGNTCDTPADIPWLSENPDNGVTPPAQSSAGSSDV